MKKSILILLVVVACLSLIKCEEFDEDEFVGYEKKPTIKVVEEVIEEEDDVLETNKLSDEALKEMISKSPLNNNNIPQPVPFHPLNFVFEMVFISVIVVYVINYFVGKSKNEALASAWVASIQNLLATNFTVYGGGKIVKESQHQYSVIASGRQNCAGIQMNLELQKRHDLISILLGFIWKTEDVLTFNVAMEDSMDNFVFAILRKKDEKNYKKDNKDLDVTSKYSNSNVNSNLVVLTEFQEVAESLLKPDVVSALNTYSNLFVKFHVTDQDTFTSKYKKMIHFSVVVPSDPAKLNVFNKMAMFMIDEVAKISLTKLSKQKSDKNRSKLQAAKEKEALQLRTEAIQQKKLDKKKAQMELLSPEEQEKREEKERKRMMKKRMSKGVKMMVG